MIYIFIITVKKQYTTEKNDSNFILLVLDDDNSAVKMSVSGRTDTRLKKSILSNRTRKINRQLILIPQIKLLTRQRKKPRNWFE